MIKTINNEHIGKTVKIALRCALYAVLILGAVTMVFPYLWMLSTSLKSVEEVIGEMGINLIPKKLDFSAYKQIWTIVPLVKGFLNTLIVEVTVITVGVFTTTLAAYSFEKLALPAKNFLFMMLLSAMMIPYIAVLVPQYTLFSKLNMINTLLPLIIPGLFGNVAMMFFLRQYLKGIPNELFEAAKIDGCSYFKAYYSIMLPLIKPAIAAQVIFWFIGIWNDVLAPDIYLYSVDKKTLQVMLTTLQSLKGGSSEYSLMMAGAVISSLPMLAVYIAFQRFFIESLAISGIKG